MARIGVFSLPWRGHLNPFSGLAHELVRRGHEILFFTVPDFAEPVRQLGLAAECFGRLACPPGTLAELGQEMAQLDGLAASHTGLKIIRLQSEALFTEAPPVIESARLDLWLVDQWDYAASTLAFLMQADFVTIIVTLMRQVEEGVPGLSSELYPLDAAARRRDREFNEAMLKTSQPFRDFIGSYRLEAGLGPFSFDTLWSDLAQITQQPEAFEFPRRELPACFHFTGPFSRRESFPAVAFPWERLSGKPLVYASFGTIQNRNRHLFKTVAKAVAGMDIQLVISAGGAELREVPHDLPGNPIVVSYAPQREILDRAALMITHAGMNSTLECLSAGVPMVAIPIAHDQPGVSSRIVWTGTGVRLLMTECDVPRLRTAVEAVLYQDSYRKSARRFQRIIAETDGPSLAADIIEEIAATRRPVLRGDSSR